MELILIPGNCKSFKISSKISNNNAMYPIATLLNNKTSTMIIINIMNMKALVKIAMLNNHQNKNFKQNLMHNFSHQINFKKSHL